MKNKRCVSKEISGTGDLFVTTTPLFSIIILSEDGECYVLMRDRVDHTIHSFYAFWKGPLIELVGAY